MRGLARRTILAALLFPNAAVAGPPAYPEVQPGRPLSFPRDHGAHPDYRTEWWYLTGWLETAAGAPLGFQVTFFRSRPPVDQSNPSAFAPRQILFAHAAVSDPALGRLVHDQRIARQGFGLAQAKVGDADVLIDDWRLVRRPDGLFRATTPSKTFCLDLTFSPTQAILLQGDAGYSRKGPTPSQASYYYSIPQLAVTGAVRRNGKPIKITGRAWLDREWSSQLLAPGAVGWDWAGLNLDDGGAVTAFQVRGADGRAIWAGGSYRGPDGRLQTLGAEDITFAPRRRWRSPRTGALYPVNPVLTMKLADGARRFSFTPLFDDQELDSRAAGGPVYWEGAVRVEGGRGYLELTGYAAPLSL